KETYNHWCEIRESGAQGPDGTSKTFWRRMRIWTYVIDEIINGNKPDFHKALEVKEEPNDSIAYINIKKLAEKSEYNGEAYSTDADISNYAISDKHFLLRQIKLISPQIIICSGTFKFCDKIFSNIKKISERLYKTNELYLIDFFHLSNRNSYEKEFNELKNIIKNYCKYNNIK
ncbi:MAG: uracil-DNA glycosylase family protein, partial [Spirochaetaceae bacterium]|nr:uracil-DNA glycosylase family protein [Spirochaetaceae bacterium]